MLKIPGLTWNQCRMLERRGFNKVEEVEGTIFVHSSEWGFWTFLQTAIAWCHALNAAEKQRRYVARHRAKVNAYHAAYKRSKRVVEEGILKHRTRNAKGQFNGNH
jgi:hypothetical protein